MAVLSSTNLTLADWAKRIDPDGKVPVIANLLSQTNRILDDCVFRVGNLPTGHRVVIATGLPAIFYRALNQGIPPSKATTVQVDESCAILEARSEVDKDLISLNDQESAFRLSEARMFIEAMNQAMATGLFYNNPAVDPKQFLGLAARYSLTTAGNGQNIILGGGTTPAVQTSIWLVCWGEETVFCPFPKGSSAGLKHEDLGRQTVYEAGGAGLRMEAMVDWFQWKNGLVVKDWRYAVRIPNVEVSHFAALTSTQAPTTFTNILHKMAMAVERIPAPEMGRCAFYMNRTVHSGMTRLALEKSQNVLAINSALNQFGTPSNYLSFMNIPIRRCDALINTEALVA